MKAMKRKGKNDGTPLFHQCSVLGCRCSKSYLYYRSDSQAGGVYLCDKCADEIADLLDDVGATEIDVETVIAGFEEMYPEYKVVKADSVEDKLGDEADAEPITIEEFKQLYPNVRVTVVGDNGDTGELGDMAETDIGDGSAENPFKIPPVVEGHPDPVGEPGEPGVPPETVSLTAETITLTGGVDLGGTNLVTETTPIEKVKAPSKSKAKKE